MRFDVIIGNPPYNPPMKEGATNNGSGNKIWHKFVEKSFEVVQEGGYIAMVTPNNWRTGKFTKSQVAKMQAMIFDNKLIWWKDANQHFRDVNTETDAWIVQNIECDELPSIIRANALLPNDMDSTKISVIKDWLKSIDDDCYIQDIKENRSYDYSHTRGEKPTDNIHIYKHVVTGSKTRKGIYNWFSKKTQGFDSKKVIIFDSSGPNPVYDSEGTIGCGHNARAFSVSNDQEAKEIVDFFSSKLCDFIIEIVSIKIKTLRCPTQMFKRIPKNWRELEEKHFG